METSESFRAYIPILKSRGLTRNSIKQSHISPNIYSWYNLSEVGIAGHSVYAQSLTLHSGDRITVDSTGTHGIISGHQLNNKITSYTSNDSVRGVDNDAIQINGTASSTLGSGGTITGGSNDIALEALDGSKVTISGGTITGKNGPALAPEGNGTVTLPGGTITIENGGTGMIAGGSNGIINLFSRGKPFLVNNIAMNNTSLAANSYGTIRGILANGQPLDIRFINGGHINLNIGKPPIITPFVNGR